MIEFSKDNELREAEALLTGTMELCIDHEHVSIPTSRYEELIRAETERDVLLRAYQARLGYSFDYVLQAVLGPLEPENPGEGGGDA